MCSASDLANPKRQQIQTYGRTRFEEENIIPLEAHQNTTFWVSPDGLNGIRIQLTTNGLATVFNDRNLAYAFNIISTINGVVGVLALVEYVPDLQIFRINNTWSVAEREVRYEHLEREQLAGATFSIRFHTSNFQSFRNNRLDVRVGNGHFSALSFTRSKLFNVRFNGNFLFNRFADFIDHLIEFGIIRQVNNAFENAQLNENNQNVVQIRCFGRSVIEGPNIVSIEEFRNGSFWASPDGVNVLRVVMTENGILSIDKSRQIPFRISITTDTDDRHRILANIQYNPQSRSIEINNNWMVTEKCVFNRMINEQPPLQQGAFFSININRRTLRTIGQNRLDLQIGEGIIASLFFSRYELLFTTRNGNFTFEQWNEYLSALEGRIMGRNQGAIVQPALNPAVPIVEQPAELADIIDGAEAIEVR